MLVLLATGITLGLALLLAIDDLFFDTLFFLQRKPKSPHPKYSRAPERRLAVIVPFFQATPEALEILGQNLKTSGYENFHIFLGQTEELYRRVNDRITALQVSKSCQEDKGRFLNEMLDLIFTNLDHPPFEGFVFLSWRDEWHPKILSLINHSLENHSVMQLPAISKAPKARFLVLGALADEITEIQQRETALRAQLELPFPLHSSGLVLSRALLLSIKRNKGEVFSRNLSTELEPLTLSHRELPHAPAWLQGQYQSGARSELISTKISLPPHRAAAIAWKSARTQRLLKQGLQNFQTMSPWEKYFFWRDTRATWASLVKSLAAALLLVALIQTAGAVEVMPLWMQNLSLLNGALWLRRILGRMICLKGVHNWSHTLLAPFRWPMGNMLHSLATWRAVREVSAQAWRARFSQSK